MDVDITSDDEERGFNSNDVDDLVRQMRYISRRLVVTVERIEIAIRKERNPSRVQRLEEALRLLLADVEDYQRINNLGGENNHAQVMARAVLGLRETQETRP